MVDIQTVSIAVASASVVVGVIYYSLQIRHQNLQIQQQNKIRQTDLVMKLYSQFNSLEFQKMWHNVLNREAKNYNEYNEKYGPAEVSAVGMFFEGIGILLKRELIDIELVDDMFTMPINDTWLKIKDMTFEIRKIRNQPTILEWFEYLYNEMKKREQKLQQSKA
jgi:hypothetical protein